MAEAQVPGPGRKRPMPKKVEIAVAQSGAEDLGAIKIAGGLPARSSFFIGAVQIGRQFVFGRILQRGRDHICTAGPFSEIDQAAALAAEWKIGAPALNRLFANGATQIESALASHRKIVR